MQLKKRRKKRKLDHSQLTNGAYQQGKTYIDHLTTMDNVPKDLEATSALFDYPQALKGKTDYGTRQYMVFYFDTDEDFQTVLSYLADYTRAYRNVPHMDTTKLVRLVKEAIKNDSKE